MNGVTGSRLHDETEQGMVKPRHNVVKWPTTIHLVTERFQRHLPAGRAFSLHECLARRRVAVQRGGESDHSLAADGRHLDHRAIFEHGEHRYETTARKEDLLHGFASLVN